MRKTRVLLFAVLLGTSFHVGGFFGCSYSHFIPRPQGVNSVFSFPRHFQDIFKCDWPGVPHKPHRYKANCHGFWADLAYTRSFRARKLACYLFGSTALQFSGSRVENRKKTDILADNFGLPSDFESTVGFCPLIQNVLINWGAHLDLGWLHKGMYIDFSAPLVHARWNLRAWESIKKKGTNFSPAGYLSGGNLRLERNQLVNDVLTSFQGGATFGDMQDPLRFGKICGVQTRTELADIRAEFHWDFKQTDDYTVGGLVILSAPTGTRTRAEYLFEPIIGNNHHWELGLGVQGHWDCWQDKDDKQSCRVWGHLKLSHLFRAHQRRSFDLKNNGRGSRYMLLSVLGKTRDDILQVPAGTTPAKQYLGHLVPTINVTTLDAKISIGLQGDLVLAGQYRRGPWTVDAGYNLWFRTKEKLNCRQSFRGGAYAPKGDAQLYGFTDTGVVEFDGVGTNVPVPLNVTQSKATVRYGQGDGNSDLTNQNADNSVEATDGRSGSDLLNITDTDDADLALQDTVFGSNPPVLLSNADIDECSGLAPRASSSKLFATCSYAFKQHDGWQPYLGGGLDVEIGHGYRALSRFGIWLSVGIVH